MSTSPSSLASASSKDDVSSSGVSSSGAISNAGNNGNSGGGGGDGGDELHQWNGTGDDEDVVIMGADRCSSPIMLGNEASGAMTMLSSLDCWDYTIELECLRGGPEGYYLYLILFLLIIIESN